MTTKGLNPSLAVGMKSQGTGCRFSEYRAGNKFNEGSNGIDIKSTLTSSWDYYGFKSNLDNSQEVDNSSGPLNITTCNFGNTNIDPTSQCNKSINCVYAVPREDIAIHRSALRTIALGGMKYDTEGQALIGTIVNAYNDSDDDAGLIEFFEDQGDENAYRLLIPLYIEAARYTDIDTPIARMSIDSAEKAAYKSYYEILIDLKQSDRRPNQLTGGEYTTVETLASADYEVSAFARALLEEGYGVEWEHYIEEESPSPISFQAPNFELVNVGFESSIYEVSPNPAGNFAIAKTYIHNEDEHSKPKLVLCDITGKLIATYPMQTGDNITNISTENLNPGLYVLSLMIKDKVKENRKLAVVH